MRKIPGRNGGELTILDKGDPGYANAGAPPKKDIIEEITKLMEGDGYATIEGELLDENGKRTGQMVKVRASVPNMSSAARAYAANMKKGDTRTLQIYLERTLGKVPDNVDVTSKGQSIAPMFTPGPIQVEILKTTE